jgi:hypothetical protein
MTVFFFPMLIRTHARMELAEAGINRPTAVRFGVIDKRLEEFWGASK